MQLHKNSIHHYAWQSSTGYRLLPSHVTNRSTPPSPFQPSVAAIPVAMVVRYGIQKALDGAMRGWAVNEQAFEARSWQAWVIVRILSWRHRWGTPVCGGEASFIARSIHEVISGGTSRRVGEHDEDFRRFPGARFWYFFYGYMCRSVGKEICNQVFASSRFQRANLFFLIIL